MAIELATVFAIAAGTLPVKVSQLVYSLTKELFNRRQVKNITIELTRLSGEKFSVTFDPNDEESIKRLLSSVEESTEGDGR